MGLGDLVRNLWEEPEWSLPDENELTKEIEELDKKIKTMPKKSSEKTKLIYTIANKMQILIPNNILEQFREYSDNKNNIFMGIT